MDYCTLFDTPGELEEKDLLLDPLICSITSFSRYIPTECTGYINIILSRTFKMTALFRGPPDVLVKRFGPHRVRSCKTHRDSSLLGHDLNLDCSNSE